MACRGQDMSPSYLASVYPTPLLYSNFYPRLAQRLWCTIRLSRQFYLIAQYQHILPSLWIKWTVWVGPYLRCPCTAVTNSSSSCILVVRLWVARSLCHVTPPG